MNLNGPGEGPTKKKAVKPRRLRNRSIALLSKQALTCISREIDRLLDLTHEGSLDKIDSAKLIDYVKVLNDIKKMQAKEAAPADSVSLKELERIAAKDEG